MKIPKKEISFKNNLYLWQTKTYGKNYYLSDEETHIYRYRPMPCTPAGDLIERFDNFKDAYIKLMELQK